MNGLTHRWTVSPGCSAPVPEPPRGVEPLVARVLAARGMADADAMASFLDVRMSGLHDPSMMPGLDRAARRILDAASAGEPVVIYGDYDVDGIAATAILFHILRAVTPGAEVRTYVPHRLDEGYGLHAPAMEQLASEGARVVVSVDCGVTAFAAADAARQAGMDLIITDHHQLDARGQLPAAWEIVHPRLPGSSYPFGELCGASVAFKLAWRIATLGEGSAKLREPTKAVLLDALALAGMATITDVVPLVGENRVIARHGLRRLKSTSLVGLRALIEASNLSGEKIDAEQVGFILGPRLNACGRLGHARDAVELLTVAGPERALELARELTKLNEQRRRTERKIFEQAEAEAERQGMTGDDRRAIVLAHEDWHAGVVGIVCSRLIGLFHRPTILMHRSNGHCHGSGRSIDGFDLHGALSACAPMLTKFGGHEMAAGLTLDSSRLEEFTRAFIDHATSRIGPELLTPALSVDCEARIDDFTPRAVEQLEQLGPFGRGNHLPRVVIRGVEVARQPESMGAHGAHLVVFVRQGSRELRLIGWNWAERRERLRPGSGLDVVVEPKVNRWNGSVRVEAELKDAAIL